MSLDDEDELSAPIKGIESRKDFFTAKLPKGYLSVSQVNLFLKCGEQYKRRYVYKEESTKSSAAALGSSIHKAAEVLHTGLMDARNLTEEEVLSVFSDYYDNNIEGVVFDAEEEETPGLMKDMGIKMTKAYRKGALGEITEYKRVKPIAAERIVETKLSVDEGEPIPFVAVIDLEEYSCISDVKTKSKAAGQIDADNSLQLSIYSHITKKPDVRLDQVVRPTKKNDAKYLRTQSHRDPTQIKHALEVVHEVAQDIALGRFRKTSPENWWCSEKWCPYWKDCRGKKV